MINITRDPDGEIVREFLKGQSRELRLWLPPRAQVEGKNPLSAMELGDGTRKILERRFAEIRRMQKITVTGIDLFERNDTRAIPARNALGLSCVSLPALELKFSKDGFYFIGFIEGTENIKCFFLGLIEAR